jgi:hypothetical protein
MQTFNKLSIVFLMFLMPFRLFCQLDVWTTSVPLTDSLTDNRNALVSELNFYDGLDFYVFWEKSFDTASTHIYVKRYYFPDEAVALIEGDFHNIDPCLLRTNLDSWPPEDTLFYLFYLSDQDGDFDIYYIIYTTNGITEPVALNNTTGDEKHLRSNSANGLTWDYEGKIMYSSLRKENNGPFYFTDPVVIDSGNCKNPVLETIPSFNWSEKYLAWEKVINDSSKVMLSQWVYPENGWSIPEMIYDTGNCTNLLFEESSFSEVATTLSWDQLDAAGDRKIVCTDPYDLYFFFLDLEQQQEYFPTVFNIIVGVSDIWFYALMSFIKDENGQPDVFGGYQGSWPYDHTNLSNSSAIETNPHLWNGIFYGTYQDVINIWESQRDGHWQLYTSRIQVPIFGAVGEEKQKDQGLLNVSPNPFTDQLTVSFKSDISSKASIVMYDGLGKKLGILLEPEIRKGEQSWVLNPEIITGHALPAGIYFIWLEADAQHYSLKLIKSRD